jgi:tetratricopeptide (TPR) repeat protein
MSTFNRLRVDTYQKVLAWKDRLAAAETASRDGNRSRAELLYRQALEMSEKLSDQEQVTTLIHLADFYAVRADYVQAEPLYRQAAELYERTFGPRNFIGAMCLRSLGEVLEALGKEAEAQSVRVRVTEILGALS